MPKNTPAANPTEIRRALTRLSTAVGVPLSWEPSSDTGGGTLTVGTQPIALPALYGESAELFGIEGFLPTVPRADDRDKLLWRTFQEAQEGPTPDRWNPAPVDAELRQEHLVEHLRSRFTNADARSVIAQALEDRFFSTKQVPVLLPIHAMLPMNYAHSTKTGTPARYRMFSGELLPFLLWDNAKGEPDIVLAQALVDVITGNEDLTRLDELFLEIAKESAQHPGRLPQASALMERNRYAARLHAEMQHQGGAFCQPSLDLFRRDLETVLETRLPRPDKIAWLTLLVSLHVAARLYRIAIVKGGELDLAVAAAAEVSAPQEARLCRCDNRGVPGAEALGDCPFAGAVRFRVGTGRYEPVSQRDPCRASYASLDQRRLLSLPATLITANLAIRAWSALGGGDLTARGDLQGLASALAADPVLRQAHSAACSGITVLHHAAHRGQAAMAHELIDAAEPSQHLPGLHVLRQDVLRMRRRDLRHQSRDIVNQLLLEQNTGPGSLVSRNGTLPYYELDERLLLLLVRLVCRNDALPFDEFVRGMRAYGLAPQTPQEQERLADALERLGLLVRYSDAGESAYVHHAL
jgi:hypothetical protein